MKNLHILPTDKPSRLVKFFTNKFHLCEKILPIQDEEQYQHIYITNDEEIKEGDYIFANQGAHKVTDIKNDNYPYGTLNYTGDKIYHHKNWKKIILTTDQDLIKDGVQAIDDEFLEWFVKNPSWEWVEIDEKTNEEIEKELNIFGHDQGLSESEYEQWLKDGGNLYKIIIPREQTKFDRETQHFVNRQSKKIGDWLERNNDKIPKEELKQTVQEYEQQGLEKYSYELEPKQETLEEAAERYNPVVIRSTPFGSKYEWTPKKERKQFINGAKWQQKRSYSEEDLREAFRQGQDNMEYSEMYGFDSKLTEQEWFEQFKNK